jgi:hypothetical protein
MFTAAFDASGAEHDQIALVVAGFISSGADWIDFEKQWMARLSEDDIEYFHMVEFAQSRGQFATWRGQESRRRDLLSDLLAIIATHCYRKFGCGILIQEWSSLISDSNKARFHIGAYAMAGSVAVATVDSWSLSEHIMTPVEVVFEDGDTGKSTLRHILTSRNPEPLFRPKRSTVRADGIIVPAFTPLQAADLLSYELLLLIRNLEGGMRRDPRYPLGEFYNIPGEIKYMKPANIREFDGLLGELTTVFPDPRE